MESKRWTPVISDSRLPVPTPLIKADYTYGTKKSSNFNLSLLKPLRGRMRSTVTGNIYQVFGFCWNKT